jgi:hypothetical protein
MPGSGHRKSPHSIGTFLEAVASVALSTEQIGPRAAQPWIGDNGYAQYTQTVVSSNGLEFRPRPTVSLKTSYLRLFRWNEEYYGMARLGVLSKARNPFSAA